MLVMMPYSLSQQQKKGSRPLLWLASLDSAENENAKSNNMAPTYTHRFKQEASHGISGGIINKVI